jgi:hypothetical protein
MNLPESLIVIDGITVKKIPSKMFLTHQDQVRQVTLSSLQDLAGLRLEQVVRIFRGNTFVGVSKKNLDGLVATWIAVWKQHGTF